MALLKQIFAMFLLHSPPFCDLHHLVGTAESQTAQINVAKMFMCLESLE